MEVIALCTIVAALNIIPDRSQFFQYETVSLSCVEPGTNSSDWRVKRNTSSAKNEECANPWGKKNESHCNFHDIYHSDSGAYWCEFGAGECSDAVNITVTAGTVILESPVHPVQEGDAVTLRCTNQTTSSTNLTAEFYKDDLLVRSSSTGDMTIHSVRKSDEGFYQCDITGGERSAKSWLAVRAGRPESFQPPLALILLPVLGGICLSLASVALLYLWRKRKGKAESDVAYTDVTITQEVPFTRQTEINFQSTVYSKLKAVAT
ncbi:low affinity immunoglobulin gamma Fc region receptor II-like isoform X1 [Seriola dumerili]|uniref:low affinity immunoglobulin gamma Fc region receptor II-like isoform X1 n=1 Tax=Seriola dumerili TaxID=41447 RepID=UPI000BBE5EE1|nr:low affinity immunoglobulin gamma Fc region receptor II-like isoform X1 [Seriola dumerili]